MKKNILSLAALLIASATFVACSSDDNIINEQPTNPTGKYTMTINASKGGDATTRALSLGRNDADTKNVLNATWATTENIYVKKGDTWATGSLQPDANAATATLKGELSGITIAKDDVLTLQFPKSGAISYDGQVGTLEDIAANFDYATASVTVASVSATGNIIPTEATTTFTNQQAIVKFTLKDKADDSNLNATQLTVSDGTTDYTINPTPATSEIYAAIPGFTGKTVTLTATVGGDTYTYEKTGVSFTNGQYYEITVKMTKQSAAYTLLSAATTADYGKVVCAAGHLHEAKKAVPAGCTAVGIVGKVTETGYGLILALQDATSQTWNTINGWESVTAYAGTTLKLLPDAAARGSLTSYTALGSTAVSNWAMAQKSDYEAIFINLGSTTGGTYGTTYDANVNAYITTGVGGTAISGISYLSATEYDEYNAWFFKSSYWDWLSKTVSRSVRPVLGFGGEAVVARTLAEATAEDLGKIAGADGNIYDTKAAAETAGTTAVAMIAYVGSDTDHATYKHGLAIALSDERGSNWSTAKTTCESKTAVSGAAWVLPSRNQWNAMYKANGGNEGIYSGLKTAITTAGGTALLEGTSVYYWSSTEYDANYAYNVVHQEAYAYWAYSYKNYDSLVRACLAF